MIIKKTQKFFLIILMLLPISCGFKVLNKSEANNYSIKSVIAKGDKRIGYKIKNYLLTYSNVSDQNQIMIYLDVSKDKIIKEKNIKNEITKYQINIKVNLNFYELGNTNDKKEINLSIEGDYSVDQIHSRTTANEKKLIENLIENISGKLLNEIGIKLNDI